MRDAYFISAYTTSPSPQTWNPLAESIYFQGLSKNASIVGIEHPFLLNSPRYPLAWLLENIPPHWSLIITALPALMAHAKKNPWFGLASERQQERKKAILFMEKIAQKIVMLHQAFGRKIVKAVHFHSSPPNDTTKIRGHKMALQQSLYDMKNMDWDGTALNLEHCDAYMTIQPPEKGFLSLEEELEALHEAGGYGVTLNWARSAIEGRSALTPLQHLCMTQKYDLLRGFFFSGCSASKKSAYGYWKDTHMPPHFANSLPPEEVSLLGSLEIARVLALLENNSTSIYQGIKVTDASNTHDVTRKINLNVNTISAIQASAVLSPHLSDDTFFLDGPRAET